MKKLLLTSTILLCIKASYAQNTWTKKANFGGAAREYATGFTIGGKGYIGTGYDFNSGFHNDFWEYDPASNIWTQKADFRGGYRQLATGFSIGSKGYIGTGYDQGIDARAYKYDFWEYDPSLNTWTQKADFGGNGRWAAVGFSIGSKGYIGTGSGNSAVVMNDFWEY